MLHACWNMTYPPSCPISVSLPPPISLCRLSPKVGPLGSSNDRVVYVERARHELGRLLHQVAVPADRATHAKSAAQVRATTALGRMQVVHADQMIWQHGQQVYIHN